MYGRFIGVKALLSSIDNNVIWRPRPHYLSPRLNYFITNRKLRHAYSIALSSRFTHPWITVKNNTFQVLNTHAWKDLLPKSGEAQFHCHTRSGPRTLLIVRCRSRDLWLNISRSRLVLAFSGEPKTKTKRPTTSRSDPNFFGLLAGLSIQ